MHAEAMVGLCFWLVDPLDGTREFINCNGEFTVNIALIENGEPVLGVVFAPALQRLFAGARAKRTYILVWAEPWSGISQRVMRYWSPPRGRFSHWLVMCWIMA